MGALTYAGCDVGARLLIAAGTAVAGQPGDAFLAGTLATQMIAGLASGANGMAVAACAKRDREGEGDRREYSLETSVQLTVN